MLVEVNFRLMVLLACVMTGLMPLIRRYDPLRPASRLVNCAAAGVLVLSLWNLLPGLHIGVNPLSSVITGWLGAPGMALLAFAKALTP